MTIVFHEVTFQTSAGTDIIDLSEALSRFLAEAGILNGQLVVHVPGSTAGVTTIEYESGVLEDLRQALERLAPASIPYHHDQRWGDGNGYAHVRAALLGPSLSIPVRDGHFLLGTWQQVVCLDFDNRPRHRRILFQLMGE